MYNSESLHGSTPFHGDHYNAKGIFVYLLYRNVHLPDLHRLTGTTDCVLKLWISVVPLTAGVPFRKLARLYTIPGWSLWYEQHFRRPAVWICTANWRTSPYGYHRLCTPTISTHGASYSIVQLRWCTTDYGCVHKLSGPVVPHTAVVQYRKCTWQYNTPKRALTCKRHFCTLSVLICQLF